MSKIDFVMRDKAGYLQWTCQDWFTMNAEAVNILEIKSYELS